MPYGNDNPVERFQSTSRRRDDVSLGWLVLWVMLVIAVLVTAVAIENADHQPVPTVPEQRAALLNAMAQNEPHPVLVGEAKQLFGVGDLPLPDAAVVLSLNVYDDLPALPLEQVSYRTDETREEIVNVFRTWAEGRNAQLVEEDDRWEVHRNEPETVLLTVFPTSLGDDWIVSVVIPRPE